MGSWGGVEYMCCRVRFLIPFFLWAYWRAGLWIVPWARVGVDVSTLQLETHDFCP